MGVLTMRALKLIGADAFAVASVFAVCWAVFATGRLVLVSLGVRPLPPIHQEILPPTHREVFKDIVAARSVLRAR